MPNRATLLCMDAAVVEDIPGTADLDDFPQVHDCNPVCHIADHGQVVADEQV